MKSYGEGEVQAVDEEGLIEDAQALKRCSNPILSRRFGVASATV